MPRVVEIVCPHCDAVARVTSSDTVLEGRARVRHFKCLGPEHHRFKTLEQVEATDLRHNGYIRMLQQVKAGTPEARQRSSAASAAYVHKERRAKLVDDSVDEAREVAKKGMFGGLVK